MSTPREGMHVERVVDGRTFDIWPLIWTDGYMSWEVRDVATGELLTEDESFDDSPSDNQIRNLFDYRLCKTCDMAVFDYLTALRDHMAGHNSGAASFSYEQIRDCYRSR